MTRIYSRPIPNSSLPLEYQPAQPPPFAALARPTMADRFLAMLAIVLLGYALFGRAFAYIGVPPIFIGEITVLIGLLTLLSTPRWTRMFRTSQALILIPFGVWGLMRTVPFIKEYKFDALRDAVIWAYCVFAFYMASVLLAQPTRLNHILSLYDKFTKLFLSIVPIVWLLARFAKPIIPQLPWADVDIITIKDGDAMVHLSGILAFWASGLAPPVNWRWAMLLTFQATVSGVIDRGGLVAFLAIMVICFVLRPNSVAPWRLGAIIGSAMAILAVTGITIPIAHGGKDRDISFEQIVQNIFSVGKSSKATGLDATKEWRINWWNDIVDYTVHGPYFWGGKGYGPNLATEDGYQVTADESLRSPHNIHMTILARGGVMGTLLWAAVHVIWGFGIAWGYLTARRRKLVRWAALFLFLGCYWAAFLINGSFDVYLEGPMGGIWFWTIVGTGIAALWVYRKQPEILEY